MISFRYLSITCLFLVCLVSVGQEVQLIPYEHKGLGLWGYRNPTTREITIQPSFDEAGEFLGNIAPVKIGKKWGLIGQQGQIVVEPKFDEIGQFFESFFGGSVSKLVALVKDGDDFGFIHENGKMVSEYDQVNFLNQQGLALVKKDGKYGFIDQTGKEIISPIYDEVGPFSEQGLALVKKDGKSGFIDQTGKEVIPLTLKIDFFNMVKVEKDGKWSVIDLMAKEVTPLIDHYGDPFLLRVNIGGEKNSYGKVEGGKWGVIDLMGEEVIPLIYDRVWDFNKQGLAQVKKDGKRGLIDTTGKEIIPLIYDGWIELNTLSEELIRITVQKGKKWSCFVLYVPQLLTTQGLEVR